MHEASSRPKGATGNAIALIYLLIAFPVFAQAAGLESQHTVCQGGVHMHHVVALKTIDRFYDPVECRAELSKDMLGEEIAQLRLYSFSDGSLHQVPFQVDEWTPDGHLVFDIGPEANPEQGNGILDVQDMLVFMARDAGDRVVVGQLQPEGADKAVEIEIVDPLTNGRGWYYLLHFSGTPPDIPPYHTPNIEYTDEIRFTGATYGVQGTNRTWKGQTYKTLVNRYIWTSKAAGGDGRNFIDRLKYRFQARFLFGTIRMSLHEDAFIGGWTRLKTGPVRAVVRQWLSLTLPLGLKSPRFYADCYGYDTMMLVGLLTDVPINPKYVATNFRMMFGHDLHDPHAYGMLWYNSNNLEGFIVDGVASPSETAYDDGPDDWRCVVGPNGWIVYRSTWDEFYRAQADIKVHYSDDRTRCHPPEYYPGDLGYAYTESVIKSLKPRKYEFQVDCFVPYDFYDQAGLRMDIVEELANIRAHPIQVRVGPRQERNTSWRAAPVAP